MVQNEEMTVSAPDELVVVVVAADATTCELLLRGLPTGTRVLVADSAAEAALLLQEQGGRGDPDRPGLRMVPGAVMVGADEIHLTHLEHDLLSCLLSPEGRVWSLQALSETVWGTSFVGDGGQVRAVVKRLRRKLQLAESDVVVESVRGHGLRAVRCVPAVQEPSWNCPTTAPEEALPAGAARA